MLPQILGNRGPWYFYENWSKEVFAMEMGRSDPSHVDTSRYSFPHHSDAAEKVKTLITNSRAAVTFNTEENKVVFRPLDAVEWKSVKEISHSGKVSKHFVTKEGWVCYTIQNEFYIWNPEEDAPQQYVIPCEKITTVIRTSIGEFFFGDKEGNIHTLEGKVLNKEGKVKKLVLGRENQIIAHIGDRIYAIDSTRKEILSEMEAPEHTEILTGGHISYVQDEILYVYEYEEECGLVNFQGMSPVYKSHALEDKCWLLLRDPSKGLTMKDKVNVSLQFPGAVYSFEIQLTYREYIKALSSFDHAFASKNSFAVPIERNKGTYRFYPEKKCAKVPGGCWGVVASCRLMGGSIAYCTSTRNAKFVVVSEEGEVLYTCGKILKERDAKFISELPNGNLVIGYWQGTIEIIQPVTQRELGAQEIKQNNFYAARRFFEKAMQHAPWDKEMKRVFTDLLYHKLHNEHFSEQQKKRIKQLLRQIGVEVPQGRRYRNRLFVGEGGFLYSEALVKKQKSDHPLLAKHIVATELMPPEKTSFFPRNDKILEIQNRVAFLEQEGVRVEFGVDATRLHEIFAGKHFERIHWNCPFGDPLQRWEFYPILPQFFRSASKIQKPGDRIHIALDQSPTYWKTRQAENPLLPAAALSRYRLIRKRHFDNERYPGYEHQITKKLEKYADATEGREFVFEKTGLEHPDDKSFAAALKTIEGDYNRQGGGQQFAKAVREFIEKLEDPEEKQYKVGSGCEYSDKGGEEMAFYYGCSTDEDSSDYYSSDDEGIM